MSEADSLKKLKKEKKGQRGGGGAAWLHMAMKIH